MFCQNCGKEIQDDWRVCPNCGTPVQTASNNPTDDYKSGYVDKVDDLQFKTDTKSSVIREEVVKNNSNSNFRIGTRLKIWGWLFTALNLVCTVAVFRESIIVAVLIFISAILFCPLLWNKTQKKWIWIIIGCIIYIAGWGIVKYNCKPGNSTSHNNKNVKSTVESQSEITKGVGKASDDDVDDSDEVDSDEETGYENKTDFYPTDKVSLGDWNITVWITWVSHNDVWDLNEVNCLCDIENVSNTQQAFYSSDLITLDNNGIIKEASSDYDGQQLAAGSKFSTTLTFDFPDNSNSDYTTMIMNSMGKTIKLSAKPQTNKEYYSIEGTYTQTEANTWVITKIGTNSYSVISYNPYSGIANETIEVNDNKFQRYSKEYVFVPSDGAIYEQLENGEPNTLATYHFSKVNTVALDIVDEKEVEKGEIYYNEGGEELSLVKKGNKAKVTMYSRVGDHKVSLEYKGSFTYQSDMSTPVLITPDEDYSYMEEQRIAFPDGEDGKIVITPNTIENGWEFTKD